MAFLFHDSFEAISVELYFKEHLIFTFWWYVEIENLWLLWLLYLHCGLSVFSKSWKNIHCTDSSLYLEFNLSNNNQNLLSYDHIWQICLRLILNFNSDVPFKNVSCKHKINEFISKYSLRAFISFNRIIKFKYIF